MHHLELGKAVFRTNGTLRMEAFFQLCDHGASCLAGAVSLDGEKQDTFLMYSTAGAIQYYSGAQINRDVST